MNKFGNLVASTFMFIFGLASLWVAIKALLKGSISMASGSKDVLFSTNPIGFLFVVAFWITFGLFLIWVSSRKEVDPFQPDDSSDANGKRADYLPEPLLLYKSHAWAIGIIFLMTLFMLPLGYFSLALSQSLGAGFGLLLMLPWLAWYLTTIWRCIRDIRWQGPALKIDHVGITIYTENGHLIKWHDLVGVRLTASSSNTYLVVQYRNLDTVRHHIAPYSLFRSIMSRIFYRGFEAGIKLTSLKFKRGKVMLTAQAFLQQAYRHNVHRA